MATCVDTKTLYRDLEQLVDRTIREDEVVEITAHAGSAVMLSMAEYQRLLLGSRERDESRDQR